MEVEIKEERLRGVPISRGIAIGKPFFYKIEDEEIEEVSIPLARVETEMERYSLAVQKAKQDILQLKREMELQNIHEGSAILEAQLHILEDPLLNKEVHAQIRLQKKNVDWIFQKTVEVYKKKFLAISDTFFRERLKDFQDVARRIMRYLGVCPQLTIKEIEENTIIFAKEFTASDILEAKAKSISALVSETGGPASHAAILAKARGIPYISSINLEKIDFNSTLAILDGRTGDIIQNPSEETIEKYSAIQNDLNVRLAKLNETGNQAAETFDGYKIRLSANIEMLTELELIHKYGGSGVGLFRSEYMFLSKMGFPNEEEQFATYKKIVEKMKGLPVVIRTFDLGGDKFSFNAKNPQELNPFLGCRAIRFLLKERQIFKIQLRAILRACVLGDVSVMFPMVSALSELREAKSILEEAKEDLRGMGIEIPDRVRVGCMIEVPSAALISDLLARECDFLSIGTNDLVQYSLAVDRNNHEMTGLYTPTHPSVIRLMKLIITEANQQNIPVTICGEVAADPRFIPLLLGLGVKELSVASRSLPFVKEAIRKTSIIDNYRLAETALNLSTAQEIQEVLDKEYLKNVPEDCFYNY